MRRWLLEEVATYVTKPIVKDNTNNKNVMTNESIQEDIEYSLMNGKKITIWLTSYLSVIQPDLDIRKYNRWL